LHVGTNAIICAACPLATHSPSLSERASYALAPGLGSVIASIPLVNRRSRAAKEGQDLHTQTTAFVEAPATTPVNGVALGDSSPGSSIEATTATPPSSAGLPGSLSRRGASSLEVPIASQAKAYRRMCSSVEVPMSIGRLHASRPSGDLCDVNAWENGGAMISWRSAPDVDLLDFPGRQMGTTSKIQVVPPSGRDIAGASSVPAPAQCPPKMFAASPRVSLSQIPEALSDMSAGMAILRPRSPDALGAKMVTSSGMVSIVNGSAMSPAAAILPPSVATPQSQQRMSSPRSRVQLYTLRSPGTPFNVRRTL